MIMQNFEILNYQIIRKIGEGGMGQVFLAKNKSIHQFVAIKMLHPQFSQNPALRDRFRQEAIMLSSLDNPHIVKFLNYVENEQGIFLIMEYVDGLTLEDYIRKKTGLIVESRAFPMMHQILDAFAYAHGRGVVHRDIKPSNILVGNDGNIKILDFGIAQIISDSGQAAASKAGSIEYMSPEQTRGMNLDIRSDIYSLGVLFYQMLTGRSPYDTATLSSLEIKRSILELPLPRMKELYPHVSDEIQQLVDRATRKDPNQRFRNTREMKDMLTRVQQIVEARGGNNGGGASNGKDRKTDLSGRRRSSNVKGWLVSSGVALVVIALGVLGYWLYYINSSRMYPSYAEVMMLPQGVKTGKKDNAKSLPKYQIKYSNGRPVHVQLVDRNKQPIVIEDSIYSLYRPSNIEYGYSDSGDLESKKVYDADGALIYEVKFEPDLSKAVIEHAVVDSAKVAGYDFTFDKPSGRLKTIHYLDHNGEKMAYNGAYGENFGYDNYGRLIRVNYLDANDKPVANSFGVAGINFDYAKGNSNVSSTTVNLAGKPVVPVQPVAAKPLKKGKKHKKSYGSSYSNPSPSNSPRQSSPKMKSNEDNNQQVHQYHRGYMNDK